jgi:RNA polymerase sigma-70 factor (ECF subfamily)
VIHAGVVVVMPSELFDDLMVRLRSGDGEAAALVHRRFVRRLVALAQQQFEPWVRAKADHEGVVQSAFKSVFARLERGEFALDDWDDLWSLLTVVTVRKCRRRKVALRAGRRDAAREITAPQSAANPHAEGGWELPDREPTPAEAAMMAETFERWLLDLSPKQRDIIALGLEGHSTEAIADRLGRTERTVRRAFHYARERLYALLAEATH